MKCVMRSRTRYKNKHIVVYPDPSQLDKEKRAGGFTDISILKNNGFDVRCKNTAPLVRDRINSGKYYTIKKCKW